MGTQTTDQQCETKTDCGTYPISNCSYDVISMMYKKLKSLDAYQTFAKDFQSDPELCKLVEGFKKDETRHIEELKTHLSRLLAAK